MAGLAMDSLVRSDCSQTLDRGLKCSCRHHSFCRKYDGCYGCSERVVCRPAPLYFYTVFVCILNAASALYTQSFLAPVNAYVRSVRARPLGGPRVSQQVVVMRIPD